MQTVSYGLERFVSAVRELSDQWLPIQAHTSKLILDRFEDGTYACSRAHLAQDIRQDPGLYLYCIKELSSRMPSSDHTPLELLFRAPLEWILEIVQEAPATHSLDSVQGFQADRIKETMIAAVTSELLAPAVTIDPELGYTCSLIRQIGFSLAAWNYPTEYQKALSRVDAHHSLELVLKDALGFSPTALGSTYARNWRLCSEIQDALKITPISSSPSPFAQTARLPRHDNPGSKLRKVCEIGEKIARAMQPAAYKDGGIELQNAHAELVRHLGTDAFKRISQTARERLLRYNTYEVTLPAVASVEDLKKSVAASVQADEWKKQNIYLPKLDASLRSTLESIYRILTPHDVPREAIRQLVHEVIPAFGFPAGYVYLYSPKQNALNATLTIGEPSSTSPRKIALALAINDRLLASSAFSIKSVLRAELCVPGTTSGTAFAGRIGVSQAIGVLYLETNREKLAEKEGSEPTVRFQALQLCFAAALHAL